MAGYDLIIVGSGPAGMTAAIYGARANLSVLMLDKLAPGGQIINTNEIQNYTGAGFIMPYSRNYRLSGKEGVHQTNWDLSLIHI